ncbi:hypothetical protein DLM78_18725 [Leptospira stimsonii]|uniref:Uncharacterized protein n=1 Tax=Leptospira stimsonii TaxID=2202203 RepID=A0A8B3CM67_9LEPT|nr:hypothetical protein DLM78_18725 [Leptospira stimsonii]
MFSVFLACGLGSVLKSSIVGVPTRKTFYLKELEFSDREKSLGFSTAHPSTQNQGGARFFTVECRFSDRYASRLRGSEFWKKKRRRTTSDCPTLIGLITE